MKLTNGSDKYTQLCPEHNTSYKLKTSTMKEYMPEGHKNH